MARGDSESAVTQSVLDRLIDNEPQTQSEPPLTRSQSVRALKASVRRDLEWLLNTRRIPVEAGEEYPESRRSLYNYGLPDFTSFSLANINDRARLLRHLEDTVRLFEPRLDHVRVVPIEVGNENLTRLLRFQIEALLKMDPAPEQVTFDTVLQLASGEYQIRGERSA
jgi:type VI secretion system protein ImpF